MGPLDADKLIDFREYNAKFDEQR